MRWSDGSPMSSQEVAWEVLKMLAGALLLLGLFSSLAFLLLVLA